MNEPGKYIMVVTTCPDLQTAESIANELVLNYLGACVQILPGIKSFFRWQGDLDTAEECLVLVKTRAENYAEIESKIKSLHNYELPEIIAVPVSAGLRDYLAWIDDNTRI